jgi:hypothetical protein
MCFYYAMTVTSFFVLFGVESCCPPVAALEVSASCAKSSLFLGRVGVVGFCMFIILFFLGCSLQYRMYSIIRKFFCTRAHCVSHRAQCESHRGARVQKNFLIIPSLGSRESQTFSVAE